MNIFGFEIEIICAEGGIVVYAQDHCGFMDFESGRTSGDKLGYFIETAEIDKVAPVLIGVLENYTF